MHPRITVRDQTRHLSRSRVNCCSPTDLTVHDIWVFGFGWIRWVSLLLPATSESNSFIQLSLKEIVVGSGRGDTTFEKQYAASVS